MINHTTYLSDQHVEGVEVRGAEPELHHRTRHGGPLHNPGEENSQMDNDNQTWTLSLSLTFHLGMLLLVTGGMELNEPAQ